jgi:anti-sigma-K factor RskA
MMPTNPEFIDALAGEYVLGTLQGPARRRLERWSEKNSSLRDSVQRWEDRLTPLATLAPAIEPAPHVWTGIRRRIKALDVQPAQRPGGTAWRWATAAAVLLAAVFLFWTEPFRATPLQDLTNVTATNGQVLWHIAVDEKHTTLHIRAVQADARASDRDFELWALSPSGGAPVSLGVMPLQGEATRPLTATQRVALLVAKQVAVTLERSGGSPTGGPQGPVVHVNAIQRAG